MDIVDSHVHFWDLARLDYPWLAEVPPLRRTFRPEVTDLQRTLVQLRRLVRQYGRRGIVYAAQIPALTPFSHYWFVSFLKAFGVKSWANTKTVHGFMKETKVEKIVADAS